MQPSLESLLRAQPGAVSTSSCSSPHVVCYASRRRNHCSRPRPPSNSMYAAPWPTTRSQQQCHAPVVPEPEPWCGTDGQREEELAGARSSLERIFHLSELFTQPGAAVAYAYSGSSSGFPQFLPPTALHASLLQEPTPQKNRNEKSPDYFANVGDAIRTLREDIPALFQRDLNYEIYREDIVFRDPRNCFKGMKNYQTIFWSLQFHGKLFFKTLYVDVKRIWQPEDGQIKMRWTVHGIPRVPWEAEGTFDGISTYRLDNTGKIYEHCVDNVLLRDPPMATNPPLLAGLNLVPTGGQEPVPGAWFEEPQETLPAGQKGWASLLPWTKSVS